MRNAEGDYKSTEEEVNAIIRDASEEGNDGVIIEDYTVRDLDEDTIKKYSNRFSSREPDHPQNALDNETFIEMLGGIKDDRRRKIKGVTVAGMLMFGKGIYIRDIFANINFDYREEIDINSNQRWSDRFTIDGTLRIIKAKDSMEFTNPGNLKIDIESIFQGGNSKSRNPRIQKIFSLIGLGEGAGSGLSQVSLKLWMISMLPEKCLEALKNIFGKTFNLFNKDEILILATVYLEGSVNNARVQLMK